MQSNTPVIDSSAVLIRPATDADLPAVLALLATTHLPPDGLAPHWPSAFVAVQAEQCVGSVALEIYGQAALLRSVAVTPALQRQRLGQRLIETALTFAQARGITDLYLLTETASVFFTRLGFTIISRADVPDAVRQSVEFTTACPDSALAMTRHIV